MEFKDILKALAPVAGTLIGGPLGGMALKGLADAIGIDEPTQEKVAKAITSGNLTPEQVVAIRQADDALAVRLRELDIRAEELVMVDRKSARDMQIQTRARTPAVLSWVIVLAAFGLEGYVLVNGIPTAVQDLVAGRILGTLDAALLTVITFWLGAAHQQAGRTVDARR